MRVTRLFLTAALLSQCVLAARAFADAPSAEGSYQFTTGDRCLKYLKFEAQALEGGGAAGSIFFSDEAEVSYWDVDAPDAPSETHKGYYLKAEVDGLLVRVNRAVVSARVTDSSIASLLGRRVLLAVEDNGDNSEEPDRLTWGVYMPTEKSWTPSDFDREKDPGVGATWWATDVDRKDDEGMAMPPDETVSEKSFALPAYVFAEAAENAGDISVRP